MIDDGVLQYVTPPRLVLGIPISALGAEVARCQVQETFGDEGKGDQDGLVEKG